MSHAAWDIRAVHGVHAIYDTPVAVSSGQNRIDVLELGTNGQLLHNTSRDQRFLIFA
jgi:hypothetical protein